MTTFNVNFVRNLNHRVILGLQNYSSDFITICSLKIPDDVRSTLCVVSDGFGCYASDEAGERG